jgi:hypothetical protein
VLTTDSSLILEVFGLNNQQKPFRETCYERGIYIDGLVAPIIIQDLIRSLWPKKTQHKLIRIGGNADGGYLVPDDLYEIACCFSPGVSDIALFEAELQKRNIGSHLADLSVDGPPGEFRALSFTKKFLGAVDNAEFITLESWVREKSIRYPDEDLILQMDIEAGEYETIISTPADILSKFRIIVIEIHNVESWACPPFFRIVKAFFSKLLATHAPVHIHPNNCCGVANINGLFLPRVFELTLHRNDRILDLGYCSEFPHPLDRPNVPGEDLVLPKNWYHSGLPSHNYG